MLKVYFRQYEGELSSVDTFFKYVFDRSYLDTEYTKKVIKEIDNSDLISRHLVMSPVLGGIPVEKISGGAKTVLIANYYPEEVMSLGKMGENCLTLFFDICNKKDITVIARTPYNPYNYGYKGSIELLDLNKVIDTRRDYSLAYADWDKLEEEEFRKLEEKYEG